MSGGRIIDPSQGLDGVADLLLDKGVVVGLGRGLTPPDGAIVLSVEGLVVCPGLIDLHVHLREPGEEHKETIATGARAAAAGGFTAVCAMPNTTPPISNPAAVGFIRAEGIRAGSARVYPVAAISVDRKGERLAEVGEMIEVGAVAISDDGSPVQDSGLMSLALEYAHTFGVPVAEHCEDLRLSRGGVMNEGEVSGRLGLTGIPNAAEDVAIARNLILVELTGGHLHVQHVSTRRGVELVRKAKNDGLAVTAEATPHHFSMTDEAVEAYRTEAKVNPPLRCAEDREAVREGLADGTLDAIATDHAPHHYDEKEQAFDDAPFGLVGLETAVGLAVTELVAPGLISLSQMVERMSVAPAKAFGLAGGTLRKGSPADVTVLDPEARWVVDPDSFMSKSRNTPFTGRELVGKAKLTLVGGRVVWQEEGDHLAAADSEPATPGS